MNPLARVMTCSYGQVPLHSVLDVEAPRTDVQGVSHEVWAGSYEEVLVIGEEFAVFYDRYIYLCV